MVVASEMTPSWIAGDDFAQANARLNVSVVVPALNDTANIPYVLSRIPQWIDEIVLVGATDGMVELAKRAVPNVVVVEEDRSGQIPWWRCGLVASRGEIIVTLDADVSSDPGEIPSLIGALLAGADFATSSRFSCRERADDTKSVELTCLGGRLVDLSHGCSAFWRDALPMMSAKGEEGFK